MSSPVLCLFFSFSLPVFLLLLFSWHACRLGEIRRTPAEAPLLARPRSMLPFGVLPPPLASGNTGVFPFPFLLLHPIPRRRRAYTTGFPLDALLAFVPRPFSTFSLPSPPLQLALSHPALLISFSYRTPLGTSAQAYPLRHHRHRHYAAVPFVTFSGWDRSRAQREGAGGPRAGQGCG